MSPNYKELDYSAFEEEQKQTAEEESAMRVSVSGFLRNNRLEEESIVVSTKRFLGDFSNIDSNEQ